jgi:hypothetical protein
MTTLKKYVDEWVGIYSREHARLRMFDIALTAQFTRKQQQRFFIKFDPLRRYFPGLLGMLISMAPDQESKQVLLGNLAEEAGISEDGQSLVSHDDLYAISAQAVGVDILAEVAAGRTKSAYADEFNEKFLAWIISQRARYGPKKDWRRIWAAFCAYELLDNVDYPAFLKMAQSFALTGTALKFFEIHCVVGHYGQGRKLLQKIWTKHPEDVRAGFAFIKKLQLTAFKALDEELCGKA